MFTFGSFFDFFLLFWEEEDKYFSFTPSECPECATVTAEDRGFGAVSRGEVKITNWPRG